MRGQHLDRDGAIQARIARFVNLALTARTDHGEDFLWTEFRP